MTESEQKPGRKKKYSLWHPSVSFMTEWRAINLLKRDTDGGEHDVWDLEKMPVWLLVSPSPPCFPLMSSGVLVLDRQPYCASPLCTSAGSLSFADAQGAAES